MRSIFIHEQVEFRAEVVNDNLRQGDKSPLNFILKNRGANPKVIEGALLALAVGDAQGKAEGKDFDILKTFPLASSVSLAPSAEHKQSFELLVDKNACVSSKGDSLFLRFGTGPTAVQHAPLQIGPHLTIEAIHNLLESNFQFTKKAIKSSKEYVEVKFKPSSAQRFAMVEELNLGTRFDNTTLKLRFVFKVKRFQGVDATSVKVGKAKVEVERSISENEYLIDGVHLNDQAVESCLESALKEVASEL